MRENHHYQYKNFKDLALIIRDNILKLPNDFDLIVGIPRSGIIPAYMIALLMNKRVCSLDEFLTGNLPSNGDRLMCENKEIKKILIVDDSIASGNAQKILRKKLTTIESKNFNISTLAIYARSNSKHLVDYFLEIIDGPRIFEWNYLNHPHSGKWCFDIDGVLCADPSKEENDDGECYRKFLLTAKPRNIPRYEIYALVTSRLEKYRIETEQWLNRHGVKYKHLYMLNLPSKEERQRLNAHASFKAEVYKNLTDTVLFIESESRQAKEIALLSGKPCMSVEENKLFNIPLSLDKKIINVLPKKVKKMPENIKVSVVMPVYNVSDFLQQSLNTIRCQSIENIEIICVDDGSTDDSYEILVQNAKEDKRIKIIRQKNKQAGAARNNGLKIAVGEYVIFLDPDDFYYLDMLKKASSKLDVTGADICLFQASYFDNETGILKHKPRELLRSDILPLSGVFSYKDIPNDILNITIGAPWNKLYRRGFIQKNELQFQNIKNTNDAYFSLISLVKARLITYLDEPLIYYRRNVKGSLQSNKHKAPLEFEKAYTAIQNEIMRMGIYEEVKRSFSNRALISSFYNLDTTKTFDAFKIVYDKLKNDLLEKYDISNKPSSYFHSYAQKTYNRCFDIKQMTASEYWRKKNEGLTKSLKHSIIINEDKKYQEELNAVYNSWTYRIGRIVTFVPRKIRGGIRCYKEHGINYTLIRIKEKFFGLINNG